MMVSIKGFLVNILIVMLIGFVWTSDAYNFIVGGKNGWVINPSETFNQLAERNRFQINDNLIFKYKKGTDSVLMVSKEDYDNCNTANPIRKMDDGDSTFEIDRSGAHFFISGNPGSCEKGQKLRVVVLSLRSPPSAGSPSPSPSPAPSPDLVVTNSTAPEASSSSSLSTKYSIALVSASVSLLAASWPLV